MDVDLYGDLNEFKLEQDVKEKSAELNKLQKKYNYAVKTIKELQTSINKYKTKIQLMEKNFESLLLTARTEIERKNKHITFLRNRIDGMCFRRPAHLNADERIKNFATPQPEEESRKQTIEKSGPSERRISKKRDDKDIERNKLEVKKKTNRSIKKAEKKIKNNMPQENSKKAELLNEERKITENKSELQISKASENSRKLGKHDKEKSSTSTPKNIDDILFEELVCKDFERTDAGPEKRDDNSVDDVNLNLLYDGLTPKKPVNEETEKQKLRTDDPLKASSTTKENNINEKEENLLSKPPTESRTSNERISDENEFLRVMNLQRVKRTEPPESDPVVKENSNKSDIVTTESTGSVMDTSKEVFMSQSGIFSAISGSSRTPNHVPTFFGDSDKMLSPQKTDSYLTLHESNRDDSLEQTLEKMFSETPANNKTPQTQDHQSSINESETSVGKAQVMFDLYLSSSTAPIPSGTEINTIDIGKNLNSAISGTKKRKCSTPKKAVPGRNTKMIGHRIEGFEPTISGEQTLKASKLKNALFEEALKVKEMNANNSENENSVENRDENEMENNLKETENNDEVAITEVKTEEVVQESNKKSGDSNEFEYDKQKTSTPNSRNTDGSLLNRCDTPPGNNKNTFSEGNTSIQSSENIGPGNADPKDHKQDKNYTSTITEEEKDKVSIYRTGLDPRKIDSITSRSRETLYLMKLEWYKQRNEIAPSESIDFLERYYAGTEIEKSAIDLSTKPSTSTYKLHKLQMDDKEQQKNKMERLVQEFCKSIENIDEETVPDCCVPTTESLPTNNTEIPFMKNFKNKGFSEYLSNRNYPDCSNKLLENHRSSEKSTQDTNNDVQNSSADHIEKTIDNKNETHGEKSTTKKKTEENPKRSEDKKPEKRSIKDRNCKRAFPVNEDKEKTKPKRRRTYTEEQSVNKNSITSREEVNISPSSSTRIHPKQEAIVGRRKSPRNLKSKESTSNRIPERQIRQRKCRNNILKEISDKDEDKKADIQNDLPSNSSENEKTEDKSHLNLLRKSPSSVNASIPCSAATTITKRKGSKISENSDTKLLKENISDTINKSVRNAVNDTRNSDSPAKSSSGEENPEKFSRDSSVTEKCPFQRTNLNVSQNQPQNCSSDFSLNDSQEKKNISIASANYLIEVVDKNVVNVFITRKKKRKKSL